MKITKKMVALLLALTLMLGCVIGGTVAYLMDSTEEVVNTFTTSDVSITLEEGNNLDLQMVPGKVITKDPKVTVSAESEDCYLFVKVDAANGVVLANTEGKYNETTDYISYSIDSKWTALDGYTGIYYMVVNSENPVKGQKLSVLANDQVQVLDTVTKQMMQDAAGKLPTLSFTAYAIQFNNLPDNTDAADAWELISNP